MKVAVTGGSGFIGRHVTAFLKDEFEILNIDVAAPTAQSHRGCHYSSVNILDRVSLDEALKDVDAVVHLAAIADVDYAISSPRETMEVNVVGTQTILEAIRAQAHPITFVHASTIWVYGDSPGLKTEMSPLPLGKHIYTASKIAAECLVTSYIKAYGLEGIILRFGIPFGVGGRPNGLIPSFLSRGARGLPLVVSGDGGQTRQFVPVFDLARAVDLVLRGPTTGSIYNLAYEEPISVNEVARLAKELTGQRSESKSGPPRMGDQRGSVVSTRRAWVELGWRPTMQFEDALAQFLAELDCAGN